MEDRSRGGLAHLVEKARQTMEVQMKLSMAVAYWGSFMEIMREPSLGEEKVGEGARPGEEAGVEQEAKSRKIQRSRSKGRGKAQEHE